MATSPTLPAIKPNAGTQARYEKHLRDLIDEMESSTLYWIKAQYRATAPEVVRLAKDASPAAMLSAAMADLRKQWLKRFRKLDRQMASNFVEKATGNFDRVFMAQLRNAGFTVPFKRTAAVNDVIQASVAENVSLIRSIPDQYMTAVEGHVMRSVQGGRDLSALTAAIEQTGAVTRRRAAHIALDQNNKATAAITRTRRLELGLTTAIWQHSHAGRHPRVQHVAMNGREFNVAKGMWDPVEKKWIQPGELIFCRCTSRVKLPDFSKMAA